MKEYNFMVWAQTKMKKTNAQILLDSSSLSVVGFFEILKNLSKITKIFKLHEKINKGDETYFINFNRLPRIQHEASQICKTKWH